VHSFQRNFTFFYGQWTTDYQLVHRNLDKLMVFDLLQST